MENSVLPAAHIKVINAGAGKPAQDAAPNASGAPAEGDFSNLLNAQLQAKTLEASASLADSVDAALPGKISKGKAALDTEVPTAEAKADAVFMPPLFAPALALPVPSKGNAPDSGLALSDSKVVDLLKTPTESLAHGISTAKDATQAANIASQDKFAALLTQAEPKLDNLALSSQLAAQSASAQTQKAGANTAPANAPLVVSTPVGQAGWDNAFSQRVTWVATQDQQSARIELNPPNLGPVEVRLTLNHDQANAIFSSPHGAVREAIEAALPKLREMLAESGLTLANVNVSSQSFPQPGQQQQAQSQQQPQRQGEFHIDLPGEQNSVAQRQMSLSEKRGLVDIFA